jgi:glutathione S-transferase
MQLVIGDKHLSSWSMRAWLLLRQLELKFEEIPLRLDTPGFAAAIARYSPAARVPVLIDGALHVWDSLAICEYVNEQTRGRAWPETPAARARARSLSAEMHAGFVALRSQWPFAAASVGCTDPLDADGRADLERIESIWSECRAQHAQHGPWLFGRFSAADAMYAPVTLRCRTYGARLGAAAQSYVEVVTHNTHVGDWIRGAERELEERKSSVRPGATPPGSSGRSS